MATKSCLNTAFGFFSLFLLASGITFSVLVGTMIKRTQDKERDDELQLTKIGYTPEVITFGPYWAFGFSFIFTGVIGILAAIGKAKCPYITHIVFGVTTLIVMGSLFIFVCAVYGSSDLLIVRPDDQLCKTVGEICICGAPGNFTHFPVSCEIATSQYDMIIGALLTTVIGWFLAITTTILAFVLVCKHQVQATCGYLNSPTDHNWTTAPTDHTQITGDQTTLVSNMEIEAGVVGK